MLARLGSDSGSVGRTVASDTRDPRFKSQHWQNFIYQLLIEIEKGKIKQKEVGNGPSWQKKPIRDIH